VAPGAADGGGGSIERNPLHPGRTCEGDSGEKKAAKNNESTMSHSRSTPPGKPKGTRGHHGNSTQGVLKAAAVMLPAALHGACCCAMAQAGGGGGGKILCSKTFL